MSLSLIAKSIGESATLKLNEVAAILRAKGDPVIHLGGGEPKGKAPLDAILAVTSLVNSGEVRYTPPDGIPALKQAIIRYTEDFYGWRPAPENVMASGGAKQAIMSALHAIHASGKIARNLTMNNLFLHQDKNGNLKLLNNYLNLHHTDIVLLIAWISYTLAHAKVSTTNFLFLVLQGDQGSGKSTLSRIVQALIDPCIVGVQTFPTAIKDLAIACQNAHLLCYDNLRTIKPTIADMLSIASTGGALASRQLFTNDVQHVLWLHGAIVLNGIYSFIDQPDLAQRCLPIHLLSIDESKRQSESELMRQFQADLPVIFRGLLDLVANIQAQLPKAEVVHPERMIDYVQWLAAMEIVDGVPAGVYQAEYSHALKQSMLDSLLENPLAAAVIAFIEDHPETQWSGTPAELFQDLSYLVGGRSRFSTEWPQNPIALSKRLVALQAGLRRQGIDVKLTRGKERRITITRLEAY